MRASWRRSSNSWTSLGSGWGEIAPARLAGAAAGSRADGMKITDVKTYIVGNPWKNWVFTRVDTDAGLLGRGGATVNGFAKTAEAAVHELKRFVIGQDPFDVENHTLRLFREVYSDGGQTHGRAGRGGR